MKYLRLIWVNLARKKIRTALTVGSFAVALFLFGLLIAIRGAMNHGEEAARADRLVVINRASITRMLPISHNERLARIPGVKAVVHATWFGGVYKDERNSFPQYAVDPEGLRAVYPDYLVPEAQWSEFIRDRQGCIAGEVTARRFGWKVGDRIAIKGSYMTGVFEFNLRAIYTGARSDVDTTHFWFNYAYLAERYKGRVGWYVVRLADPGDAERVITTIDEEFANSAWETKTQTEGEFGNYFAKQLGDIELLVLAIGSVVFSTLLLVSGNTMAIALRERTGEIAVLKAVGFRDGQVLRLVLAESLVMAAAGGAVGIVAAKAACASLSGLFPGMVLYLPSGELAVGMVFALGIGLLGAGFPAHAAMRLRVADALGRV
ncbi:MAG: FtsX-like permease family protein [Acidobacteriia bacterium]|nr:FtsX-like permease family protein [Terriglobia bacterium]